MIIEWMRDVNRRLNHLERAQMSDISNEAQLEQEIIDLGTAVDSANARIAALQTTVANGGTVTAADLAAISDDIAKVNTFAGPAPVVAPPTDTAQGTDATSSTETPAPEADQTQTAPAGETPSV